MSHHSQVSAGGGELGAGVLLAVLLEDGVYLLEGLLDLLAQLAAGEHDLARDEDEQHDLGLDHPVDEAGEELGLVGGVQGVLVHDALEAYGEADVDRADHVLDLEVGELGAVEADLLNNPAYFRAAARAIGSDLAPVTTTFPLLKMSAVVFGSCIRMMTAEKRFGLYSELRACMAMAFRSSSMERLHVATTFWSVGTGLSGLGATAVVDGCSATAVDEEAMALAGRGLPNAAAS
eukprot:CAMPEP_0206164080 /NCGR_PEP_ID=MMETSP1474-20131121/14101_1 /ASSEMBLY_ACC=CAM_ASM_001110 /TAXON_ID=97495 /ORGANISM="Imantonia sp., Strain RCC918" /LENGTH=233 /DNA_ID=CAMNT_0053566779 /DNA_START=33 /DNA_END=732 /DNA_ORIENTATION=-